MQRLVVLGVVAACGSLDGGVAAPRTASPPTASSPAADEAPDAAGVLVLSRMIDTKIDTSIAHIWAAPPPPPDDPPPRDRLDDLDHAVPPAPKARKPGRRAPCFAARDVLVGSEIWRDLHAYAISMSSEQPPSGRYGTCTIADGQLRDRRGLLLAELHCGISVHAPGIIDHLGFEIGADGKQIATAHEDAARAADATYEPPRVRTQPLAAWCRADGPAHTRCWFDDGTAQEPGSHYIFATATKMPQRGLLGGAPARRFFESHTVSSFTVRITCH